MENLEKVLVSRGERIVLQMLDKKLKYLSRDKDGTLCAHETKPQKHETSWDSDDYCELSAFNHHFQFIQFNDEEPWLITDIINKCGTRFE